MSEKDVHQNKESATQKAVRFFRSIRNLIYLILEPVDFTARLINKKKDLPPLRLRRSVGDLRNFEFSAGEFTAYLKLICKLKPEDRMLDVGSGCGLMAMGLADYLSPGGGYLGLDIYKPSVCWCRRNITPKYTHFIFEHIDVHSPSFNPDGKQSPDTFAFPLESGAFDVILLKSVFTHMRPPGVENYLKEVSRLLSSRGRCLATFFLLNRVQEELKNRGMNKFDFKFVQDTWGFVHRSSPESAVAYKEDFILDLLSKHNLELAEPVFYGTWTGREQGLSTQDMMLIRVKKAQSANAGSIGSPFYRKPIHEK